MDEKMRSLIAWIKTTYPEATVSQINDVLAIVHGTFETQLQERANA